MKVRDLLGVMSGVEHIVVKLMCLDQNHAKNFITIGTLLAGEWDSFGSGNIRLLHEADVYDVNICDECTVVIVLSFD